MDVHVVLKSISSGRTSATVVQPSHNRESPLCMRISQPPHRRDQEQFVKGVCPWSTLIQIIRGIPSTPLSTPYFV